MTTQAPTLAAPQHRHRLWKAAIGLAVVLVLIVSVVLLTRPHSNPRAAACEAGWTRVLAEANAPEATAVAKPAVPFATQHTKWVQTCEAGYITP